MQGGSSLGLVEVCKDSNDTLGRGRRFLDLVAFSVDRRTVYQDDLNLALAFNPVSTNVDIVSTAMSPADGSSSAAAHSQPLHPPTGASTKTAAFRLQDINSHSHDHSSRRPFRKLCSSLIPAVFLVAACLIFIFRLPEQVPVRYLSQFLAPQEINIWDIVQPTPEYDRKDNARDTPDAWLRRHSITNYDGPASPVKERPKAAFISLVRNEELDGILQSIRQLEYYFNRRHAYPWIFFSEVAFTEEFKAATSNATFAATEYHPIPIAHWSTPPNISRPAFYDSLDYLGALGVGESDLPFSLRR